MDERMISLRRSKARANLRMAILNIRCVLTHMDEVKDFVPIRDSVILQLTEGLAHETGEEPVEDTQDPEDLPGQTKIPFIPASAQP